MEFHIQFSVQNYLQVYLARPRVWMNFGGRRVFFSQNAFFTFSVVLDLQVYVKAVRREALKGKILVSFYALLQ